jgi:hypothetical protein
MRGKGYLCDLFRAGYGVIPSARSVEHLDQLPLTDHYFCKPEFGGGSVGCKKMNKTEITGMRAKSQILQPFVSIASEMSLFYLDGEFEYALRCSSPAQRWSLFPYIPTTMELNLAKQFILWNALEYGLQRIDLCRSHQNELFLMEIEDFCPFLSLADVDGTTRERFISRFRESLDRRLR